MAEESKLRELEDSPMYGGMFRTPHGIPVDLWGMVEQREERS